MWHSRFFLILQARGTVSHRSLRLKKHRKRHPSSDGGAAMELSRSRKSYCLLVVIRARCTIQTRLCPARQWPDLATRHVVAMDNLASHKNAPNLQLIEQACARVLFLQACWPEPRLYRENVAQGQKLPGQGRGPRRARSAGRHRFGLVQSQTRGRHRLVWLR